MNALNILITSASRKVSLVQSFKQVLIKESLDGFVVAVDSSEDSAALKFSDISHIVPPLLGDDPAGDFFDGIMDICRVTKVGLIVPTRDDELPFFAKHKDFFDSLGIFVAVSDLECVETCQDKFAFDDFCRGNDFATPNRIDDVTRLPVFVKARRGYGGNTSFRADTLPELFAIRRRLGESITQEYIYAQEYTVDVFSGRDSKVLSVIPRKRIKIIGGESWIGQTEKNTAVIYEAKRLAEALKLKYHSVIQCFYDGSSVKFIEVNPRYGGASNCSFAAGGDSPRWLVQMAMGRTVTAPPIGEFVDKLTMLRYSQDVFVYADDRCEEKAE